MESSNDNNKKSKTRWWVLYLIMGSIWYFGQSFKKSGSDEFIIAIIAISAGFFYNSLKEKLRIQNKIAKGIAAYFILYFVSALLMGFFTALF